MVRRAHRASNSTIAIDGSSAPAAVAVDSTGYTTGTFTGVITVTATATDVLDAPQAVPVTLRVVPEVRRVYLPLALRSTP